MSSNKIKKGPKWCSSRMCHTCEHSKEAIAFGGRRIAYNPSKCKYRIVKPEKIIPKKIIPKKVFKDTDDCTPSKCKVCKYSKQALVNTGGQRDKYIPLNCIHYYDNVETCIKRLHEKFKTEYLVFCLLDNDTYKICLTTHVNDFYKIMLIDKEKDRYNVLQMLSDKQALGTEVLKMNNNNLNTEEQDIHQACDMARVEIESNGELFVVRVDRYPYSIPIINRDMEFKKIVTPLFKKYKYYTIYTGTKTRNTLNFLEVTNDNKTFVYMEFDKCLNITLKETRGKRTPVPSGYKGNWLTNFPAEWIFKGTPLEKLLRSEIKGFD